MNRELEKIVQNVRGRYRRNPEAEGGFLLNAGLILQIEILQSGMEFSEGDVLAAASMVGVPEGSLIDWLEQMASWV
jgi:hypothetical protein